MNSFKEKLLELRGKIDNLDDELLSLLNQRAKIAQEVGEVKKIEGSAFFRPERVAQVIEKIKKDNLGPLKDSHVTAIWREIMSACLSLESQQRVAVLGPAGTFCEEAALQYFGTSADLIYCNNFDEVFNLTSAGSSQYGVVGLENSTEGAVNRSLDMLLQTPCQIVGEISLMIRHNLMRKTADFQDIKFIFAHPQALAQCQFWIKKHLPNAELCPTQSNSQGAELVSKNPEGVAIASERAATEFNLHILAHAIQDEAYNRTRFAIICLPKILENTNPNEKVENDCTSLIVSVPNKAGAVYDLLEPLKKYGVSMTRFESRPAKTGKWEYYFYIDIQGHQSQENVKSALEELKNLCAFYKFLGSYPISK